MMRLDRITDAGDARVGRLLALYEESFPAEERRPVEQMRRFVEGKREMFFNAVECDGELCGLFVYWRFEEFYYLEYLAVYPEMRNRKIGQQVLDYIAAHLEGTRLMEVEPAETEMAARRVAYYRRNGYEVLDERYTQPGYRRGELALPLWIMGNRPTERLKEFEERIREEVYWCED